MRSLYLIIIFCLLLISVGTAQHKYYYIAIDGSDTHPGTRSAPFASVAGAQKTVRAFKKDNPAIPVTVWIGAGHYIVDSTIRFIAEDGGTANAPVSYRSSGKEPPVFSGSRKITGWQLLQDASVLSLLPATVRNKVYVADVRARGVRDLGDPTEPGKRPELFCNKQVQTLARWPNRGFARAGQAKGDTPMPPTYIKVNATQEGVFEYTDLSKNKWAKEQDIRISGYWYWDWLEGFQKVEKIDTANRVIALNEPYHHYGYKDGFRYFALNLLSELDEPGEWYMDREHGLIYWYPPGDADPLTADVSLSVFNGDCMVETDAVSWLNIEGWVLQESRGSGIRMKDGNNCMIRDCRIERMGKDGMHINGGMRHIITGNFLSTLAHGGIKVSAGDRKTLTPSEHTIEHNIVEHFSLFKRTYEPAVHFEGCGIRIANNRFRYSSSSAMRLDGNDIIAEYNQVSFVVNESDDQGGIDMWYNPSYRGNIFRYNHWSDISGGTRHGAAGIRLDDMISGTLIYGNIFERCGVLNFGAVQIHGGKENIIDNNLFYDCHAAVSFSNWTDERWLKELESPRMQKTLYEDVDIRSSVFTDRYPAIKNLRNDIGVNTITNNLIVGCKSDYIQKNEKQVFSNNTSITGGRSISYYYRAGRLQKYGLQPIPFKKIGPQNNKWLSLSR